MSPRLRYGATSAGLLAIALIYALVQAPAGRPAPTRTPTPPSAARPVAPAPEPTAAEILQRRDRLWLTREQASRLQALQDAWSAESAGLRAAVDAAGEEFARFAAGAGVASRASLEDIQRRSADFRELGAAWRERQQRHARAAAALLTEGQRAVLATSFHDRDGGAR